MSKTNSPITNLLSGANLIYLGLLPALATFSILYTYGHAAPMLLFLGGTVAVAVYLAFLITYTPPPRSTGWALIQLLDGPVWAAFSVYTSNGNWLGFAIDGFLVDGTAIWIAILVLALRSPLPTRQQRLASVAFMIVAICATVWLVWPHYKNSLSNYWVSQCLLLAGTSEGLFVRVKVLKKDEVQTPTDAGAAYIVALLLVWVGSLILGNVMHEFQTR